MEKIKIGEKDTLYEIKSIRTMSSNVLQIVFESEVPDSWGDITIYTTGGDTADIITDYETVYRDEGQTVYLSNDGSIYTAPETPENPGEPAPPYILTLEELQNTKHHEITAACEKLIYTGIDVTLASGEVEHYSLTEHDQLNLFGKQSQMATGAERLEYHADGQPCRYYTAADMLTIIQAAMWHVSYHTTYCNAINMWIAGCETTNDVQEIFYGVEVPELYRNEVLNTYLLQIASMTEEKEYESQVVK